MTIAYIRRYYSVPAKVGMLVTYRGRECKITGTSGARLILRLTDRPKSVRMIVHPTDEHLKYPEPGNDSQPTEDGRGGKG